MIYDDGYTTIDMSSTSITTDTAQSRSPSPKGHDRALVDMVPLERTKSETERARQMFYSLALTQNDPILVDIVSSLLQQVRSQKQAAIARNKEEEEIERRQIGSGKRRKIFQKFNDIETDNAMGIICFSVYSGVGTDTHAHIFEVFERDLVCKVSKLRPAHQILALKFQLTGPAMVFYLESASTFEDGQDAMNKFRERFVRPEHTLTTEIKFKNMSGFMKCPEKHSTSENYFYESRLVFKDVQTVNVDESAFLEFAIYKLRPYTLRKFVTNRNPTSVAEARKYCREFEEKKKKQKRGEKAPQ